MPDLAELPAPAWRDDLEHEYAALAARNLLDRLPWESVPLGLRIALNRGARFAHAARAAHRRY